MDRKLAALRVFWLEKARSEPDAGVLLAFEQWVVTYEWDRIAFNVQAAAAHELSEAAEQGRNPKLTHAFVRRFIQRSTRDEWDPSAAPKGGGAAGGARRGGGTRRGQSRAVAAAAIGQSKAYRDAAEAGRRASEQMAADGEDFEAF